MPECSLGELPPGRPARVVRLEGQGPIRQRLQEMGLVRGTPVEFVRAAPLGDPLEVKVRGYSLTLRRADAQAVRVETDEGGE